MEECSDCGKEILEGQIEYCEMCGVTLCEECDIYGMCSNCTELWISEIDLEDEEE